jgi:signal transduction histidine kinase
MGSHATSRGILLGDEGNHSREADISLVVSPHMTPAGTLSRRSSVSSTARAEAGLVLAALFLAIGVVGYLLVGPSTAGSGLPVLWAAMAIAGATAVVLRRPTPLPAAVAAWVSPALIGSFALYPMFAPVLFLESAVQTGLAAVLLLVAVLPMVVAIGRLTPGDRTLLRAAVPAFGLAAALLIVLASTGSVGVPSVAIASAAWMARLLVLAALIWPPAVAFTVLLRRQGASGTRPTGEVLADAALLVAAFGPVVTASVLFIPWSYALSLIGLVALLVLAAFRVAVRPLATLSARAAAQRDLALSASEAERARLAADLHDGPLQDLLILARSLEARADADGARLARDVADELREMSGELRLPVLDDLGLGPALEWLAARMRRLTGLDIAADWETQGRSPAQVELAAFRVAQEAVSNAVRHGRPPIRIRCRSGADRLRLTVEDAGDGRGLDALALSAASDGERRGMLGMAQRAEQIGARLELRRAEGLGTVLVLEWEGTGT